MKQLDRDPIKEELYRQAHSMDSLESSPWLPRSLAKLSGISALGTLYNLFTLHWDWFFACLVVAVLCMYLSYRSSLWINDRRLRSAIMQQLSEGQEDNP